jgi:hypothetical protein
MTLLSQKRGCLGKEPKRRRARNGGGRKEVVTRRETWGGELERKQSRQQRVRKEGKRI